MRDNAELRAFPDEFAETGGDLAVGGQAGQAH
jgi:hypothetical protein